HVDVEIAWALRLDAIGITALQVTAYRHCRALGDAATGLVGDDCAIKDRQRIEVGGEISIALQTRRPISQRTIQVGINTSRNIERTPRAAVDVGIEPEALGQGNKSAGEEGLTLVSRRTSPLRREVVIVSRRAFGIRPDPGKVVVPKQHHATCSAIEAKADAVGLRQA